MPKLLSAEEILSRAEPPRVPRPGIYFLIRGTEVVYIGQSNDVDARQMAHQQKRRFDAIAVHPCRVEELDSLERAYLDAFLPPWNKDCVSERKRNNLDPNFSLPRAVRQTLRKKEKNEIVDPWPVVVNGKGVRQYHPDALTKYERWCGTGPTPRCWTSDDSIVYRSWDDYQKLAANPVK